VSADEQPTWAREGLDLRAGAGDDCRRRESRASALYEAVRNSRIPRYSGRPRNRAESCGTSAGAHDRVERVGPRSSAWLKRRVRRVWAPTANDLLPACASRRDRRVERGSSIRNLKQRLCTGRDSRRRRESVRGSGDVGVRSARPTGQAPFATRRYLTGVATDRGPTSASSRR